MTTPKTDFEDRQDGTTSQPEPERSHRAIISEGLAKGQRDRRSRPESSEMDPRASGNMTNDRGGTWHW